jgi:hypothetical protein
VAGAGVTYELDHDAVYVEVATTLAWFPTKVADATTDLCIQLLQRGAVVSPET